jgi:A/G-specific adenine glycosylase
MLGDLLEFRSRLLRWYDAHRRDLPWRSPRNAPFKHRPDPWAVLVSETMLQQTRVAVVIDYFVRFMERFPTPAALAEADEQDVLRLWQGLGYYSRARNLQSAARQIIEEFGGVVPGDLESLRRLKGVGRYTAAAVASLAFDRAAAVVDGNVARVICRLDAIRSDPREPATNEQIWHRASELLAPRSAGRSNSAMMELGATVCTPRSPACLICPVRAHCQAFAEGIVDLIPPPRKQRQIPLEKRLVIVLRRRDGRYLIQQRPANGRWASMWQFPTFRSDSDVVEPDWSQLTDALPRFSPPKPLARLEHQLTHRRYEFAVFAAEAIASAKSNGAGRWVNLKELQAFPLPRPHVLIAGMLS